MKFRTILKAGLILASGVSGEALAQGPQAPSSARQFSGVASYYDKNYSGRTASGATYDSTKLTAAHRTLPFGTRVRVVNQRTGQSVIVRINDRGPYARGRVIDLSKASAAFLGISGVGTVALSRL